MMGEVIMIRSRHLKAFASVFVLFLASAVKSSAQYFPPPDSAGGWRTLTNPKKIQAKTGLDVNKLDQIIEYIQGSSKHGGLLVVRHGWLVYERYFGRANRESTPNEASCGKSFTSIAMGIFMHERPDLFPDGLDQKVYTPRYLPPEAFPLNDPVKSEIKLGQLLAMTAGIRGNSPGYVNGKPVTINPEGFDGWQSGVDANAFSSDLWCKPGEGFSYASVCPHLVSVIIRQITGSELQDYVETHLAEPLGWGRWSYAYRGHPGRTHTSGGGGIALRSTDMLRFGYLLLHDGRWRGRQIVPADYVHKATTPSPYNTHYCGSGLQFQLNADGHAPAVPQDAYWQGGAGGYAVCVVPSRDLVVWKMGGRDDQYEEKNTGLPELKPYDGSRAGWKRTVDEGEAARQTLEMIVAAIDDHKK
jgi:CubicO group peptidase (beta-lactamase class C family)